MSDLTIKQKTEHARFSALM